MITNANITIFNKWYNSVSRLDEWHQTQISDVNWNGRQAVTVDNNGLTAANAYTVRIPVSSSPSKKAFLCPNDYKTIPKNNLSGFWTLQNGDIVVRGTVDEVNPKDANGEHFVVIGWNDNLRGSPAMRHWKIVGK